jgi:hypothetical protein
MVLEDAEGSEARSAAEVVGGRSHVLLPATDTGIVWNEVLPAEVPDGRLALLPDNRASVDFVLCNDGEILLPMDRVLGRPQAIFYSENWARIGLLIK